MASVEELCDGVLAARASAEQARSRATAAVDHAEDLAEQFQLLGASDKLMQTEAVLRSLETQRSLLSRALDTLTTAAAQAAALRGESSGVLTATATATATAPSNTAPGYPHHRPHHLSWSDLHHVVHGDPDRPDRGGHLHGTGRPGKTEFPAGWDEEDIAAALTAVVAQPRSVRRRLNGVWFADGDYQGVRIRAVVREDGSICAGWPVEGPGVKSNPK